MRFNLKSMKRSKFLKQKLKWLNKILKSIFSKKKNKQRQAKKSLEWVWLLNKMKAKMKMRDRKSEDQERKSQRKKKKSKLYKLNQELTWKSRNQPLTINWGKSRKWNLKPKKKRWKKSFSMKFRLLMKNFPLLKASNISFKVIWTLLKWRSWLMLRNLSSSETCKPMTSSWWINFELMETKRVILKQHSCN